MHDSWFFDENFNGVPDNFFDDVFKHVDFPLENVESNDVEEDWDANFEALEPPPPDVLAGFSHSFSGQVSNNLKAPNNHSGLSDGTSKLKQCSSSDKALSSGSTSVHENSTYGKESRLFQTSSPVSILESSSSCSAENSSEFRPKLVSPVKRARSKRPRPSIFNPQCLFPFMASTSMASRASHPLAGSESDSDNPVKRKQKKKKNLTLLSSSAEVEDPSQQPTRKCTHCEATKTPQWREGPMGPKTLCNACGVRYRSGRLLPEYRPAASPTFVPSLHSNSHRKVVEMRKKSGQMTNMAGMDALVSPTPQYLLG